MRDVAEMRFGLFTRDGSISKDYPTMAKAIKAARYRVSIDQNKIGFIPGGIIDIKRADPGVGTTETLAWVARPHNAGGLSLSVIMSTEGRRIHDAQVAYANKLHDMRIRAGRTRNHDLLAANIELMDVVRALLSIDDDPDRDGFVISTELRGRAERALRDLPNSLPASSPELPRDM